MAGLIVGEVSWLVLFPFVGWRLGGGWWFGAIVASALLVTFIAIWGRWMAPSSAHRLPFENRQLLLILLGSALTVLSSIEGLFAPAAISSLVLVWAHRAHQRTTAA